MAPYVTSMNKILVPMIIFVLLACKISCSNNRSKHHQSSRVYKMLLGLLSYIQVIILVPCSMKNSSSQATIHFEKEHQICGTKSGAIFSDKITSRALTLHLGSFTSRGFTWRRRYTKNPIENVQIFGSEHFPLLCIAVHYDGC